jgi:hypothetical protein
VVIQSSAPPLERKASQPDNFIVEESNCTSALRIPSKEINAYIDDCRKNALICRFNGSLPTSSALINWIDTNWTSAYTVSFYCKGFFIVYFNKPEGHRKVMEGDCGSGAKLTTS